MRGPACPGETWDRRERPEAGHAQAGLHPSRYTAGLARKSHRDRLTSNKPRKNKNIQSAALNMAEVVRVE